MWGHDLRRVGRVDEAIAQFLKADALERAYYAAEKIDPALDWHHGHNLDLLASCYEHKGQMKLAEKTLRESATLAPVSAYRAFNLRELPNFLIHRARYQEALEAGRALTDIDYPQSRCVGHALAGQALLWLGRPDEAKKELEAARRELETVPRLTLGLDPPRSTVEPWVEALRGELLLRDGTAGRGTRRPEGSRARAASCTRAGCVVAGSLPSRVDGAERDEKRATGISPSSLRRRCSTTTLSTAEATSRSRSSSATKATVPAPRGRWRPRRTAGAMPIPTSLN